MVDEIQIRSRKLEFLRPALEGWIDVNRIYCEAFAFNDSIYWCNERGNVGALATGAWLKGMVALEEYPHKTKERGKTKHGKPDLYISRLPNTPNAEGMIEAKLHWWGWCTEKKDIAEIKRLMRSACKQARSRKDKEIKASIGAVFVVPGLDISGKAAITAFNSTIREIIDRNCDHDLIAWYSAKKAMSDKDAEGRTRRYPGAFLLMKRAN